MMPRRQRPSAHRCQQTSSVLPDPANPRTPVSSIERLLHTSLAIVPLAVAVILKATAVAETFLPADESPARTSSALSTPDSNSELRTKLRTSMPTPYNKKVSEDI